MVEFSNGESLPPQERLVSQQWDSGYKSVALETLEKVMTGEIRRAHPESTDDSIKDQVLQKREKLR